MKPRPRQIDVDTVLAWAAALFTITCLPIIATLCVMILIEVAA